MFDMQWYDWIGIAGALLVLMAYYLLLAGRLAGTGLAYQLLNLVGAAGVLASLYGGFNVAVFVLMSAWMLITIFGLGRRMARGNGPGTA